MDQSDVLKKIGPGKYKIKDSMDLETLEANANETLNQLMGLCSDSHLVNQITFEDIEKLKHSKDLIRNHKLYFSRAIKEIEELGIAYPEPGDRYEAFESYYRRAKNIIRSHYAKKTEKVKELNDSWGGFWRVCLFRSSK